jgi:ABC-2 type transport system ATP-binding protein
MRPDGIQADGADPTDGQTPALQLSGLEKRFGETTAVDHIDLAVPQGSFFGLVGPNGAGKTTSLSMAVGLLRPDGGSARIFGVDVWADPVAAKQLVGVLPDGLALPERLTGRELLTYLGLLRGLDRATVAGRAQELLEVLELIEAERTPVIDYSAGMRKKITLATALLHTPRLLVLDEPFEAIDPVSAATIRTILRRFVDAGGSVVLSSHVMALVEQLCDRVGVIAKGRLVASGTLDQVRGQGSLEDAFVRLVGARITTEGLSWLAS